MYYREISPNLFVLILCTGGYLSSSLAIATDASHLLTDFASFMISLFSIWVASRPATRSMPFGWYRAEVLGALTSVLLIWVVTGILLYLAVERISSRSYNIDATIMVVTSAVGLFFNIMWVIGFFFYYQYPRQLILHLRLKRCQFQIKRNKFVYSMGMTLHQHSHSHGGHSSHSHEASGSNSNNINVRAAYIHVLGDVIQSLGVLVSAVVIYYKVSKLITVSLRANTCSTTHLLCPTLVE